MSTKLCPECKKGRIYSHKTEDGYTERICYQCGYYESNSEGYKAYPSLDIQLFREYFPMEIKWHP